MKRQLAIGLCMASMIGGSAFAAPPTVPIGQTPPNVKLQITKHLKQCGATASNIHSLQVERIPFRQGGQPNYFLPLEGTACDEQGGSPMSTGLSFEPTAAGAYKMTEAGGMNYLSNAKGEWIYTSVGCGNPPLDHAQAFKWDAATHRVKAASRCLEGDALNGWLTARGFR